MVKLTLNEGTRELYGATPVVKPKKKRKKQRNETEARPEENVHSAQESVRDRILLKKRERWVRSNVKRETVKLQTR